MITKLLVADISVLKKHHFYLIITIKLIRAHLIISIYITNTWLLTGSKKHHEYKFVILPE